jgi:hypothetical protein
MRMNVEWRGRSEADMFNLPNHAKDSSYNRKFCRPGQVKPPARPLSFTQCKLDIQEVTESLAPISYFWTCYLHRVQGRRQNGSYECHSDHRNHTLEPNIFGVLSICYLLQVAHTLALYAHYLSSGSSPKSRVYRQRNAPAISQMCLPSFIVKNQSSKNQQKTR